MLDSGHKLLRELSKAGELSLDDAVTRLHKRFNDHRDYYVLANLINSDYIGMYIKKYGEPIQDMTDLELARILYMWVEGGEEFEYDGWTTSGADFGKDRLYCTAKTSLYFDERRSKRRERLFVIFVAIIAAFAAALFGNVFSEEKPTPPTSQPLSRL